MLDALPPILSCTSINRETNFFPSQQGFYFSGDGARRDEDGYYWITGALRCAGVCWGVLRLPCCNGSFESVLLLLRITGARRIAWCNSLRRIWGRMCDSW